MCQEDYWDDKSSPLSSCKGKSAVFFPKQWEPSRILPVWGLVCSNALCYDDSTEAASPCQECDGLTAQKGVLEKKPVLLCAFGASSLLEQDQALIPLAHWNSFLYSLVPLYLSLDAALLSFAFVCLSALRACPECAKSECSAGGWDCLALQQSPNTSRSCVILCPHPDCITSGDFSFLLCILMLLIAFFCLCFTVAGMTGSSIGCSPVCPVQILPLPACT